MDAPPAQNAESEKKSPAYVEVASALEKDIDRLPPNSLLPTEHQIARRFGVSRVTVRAALDLLENSGRVSRQRGRGTIISPPKITRRFLPLHTFEHDLKEQGVAFETRVLGFNLAVTPPEAVRKRLACGETETVGCLSLLRSVEDRVICHDLRYYRPHIARLINPERMKTEDASVVLEDVAQASVMASNWESEIIAASPEVAEALGITNRPLVLANSYTWLLDDGTPVEAGVITYRVDRCKFRFDTSFH